MAKILIVGHPNSGYQTIEHLLHASGMEQALPSKRERMSPLEIDAALLKAHQEAPGAKALLLGDKIANRQLPVGTVWHGLAMDLFLGNIDQSLWGWADSKAISLLNYWRDMDDSMHFALIYDRPHSILLNSQEASDSNSIEQKLQEWISYNESLLHFYLRNQDRCLLMNSQQAKSSVGSYVQQIQLHIEAPWRDLPNHEPTADASKEQATIKLNHDIDSSFEHILPSLHNEQNHLAGFLADFIINTNQEAIQLYEELQAVANLPLHAASHTQADYHAASMAWQAMMQQHQQLKKQENDLKEYSNENELLLQQLHLTQEEFERAHLNHKQTEAQLNSTLQDKNKLATEYQQKTTETHQKINRLEQEKQQLLKKSDELNQAQKADGEAIKKLETAKLNLEKEKTDLEKIKATLASEKTKLEKEKNRLEQDNKASQSEQEKDNQLLLEQLHHVQEELERLFLENKRLTARPEYYGAAERVRNQLDYRLGATMIQNGKSLGGWISMPAALIKESRKPQQNTADLPPVSLYHDASEAEKMHKHLSYQLGQTLLKHSRNPLRWFTLPWAINKTVKEFRKK